MTAPLPRIGMVGMASENCTFSQARTRLPDFEVLRGDALQRRRYGFLEDPSFAKGTFLPLVHARALPGGMIDEATYLGLKEDLLTALRDTLPLDGVYLDLHGAMHVEGRHDAEVDLVSAIRELVGPSVYLGASMDLHGNVSATLVEQVDLFSAYRTAPHIDTEATRQKVCRLLLEAVEGQWELKRSWIPVPVLLPGESTSTLDEPGKSLYRQLRDFDALPGIADVSLWVGYVWADEPRAHASVVVTGTDPATDTGTVAVEVARRYWQARDRFRFNVPAGSLSEGLAFASDQKIRPVVISDSGDNPTAGGVGNLPGALSEVLQHPAYLEGAQSALVVGLWDPEAVHQAMQADGETPLTLTLGTEADSRHATPLSVTGQIQGIFDHDPVAGRQVVLRIGNGIRVVLTERRKPFHHLSDFHSLKLSPEQTDVVIVKIGYLVTELQQLAAKAFLALTPGAVDQHVTRVPYHQIQRPLFPFDPDFAWKPETAMKEFYSPGRKS